VVGTGSESHKVMGFAISGSEPSGLLFHMFWLVLRTQFLIITICFSLTGRDNVAQPYKTTSNHSSKDIDLCCLCP